MDAAAKYFRHKKVKKSKGKTITTYLIDGSPNGIKTIFISNKVCKALVAPRGSIERIKDRAEASQPSLYFLMNEDENKIYIGESENFQERIKNHLAKKSFWNIAITFFSQNNDLTKADVKYLECLAISRIKELNLIDIEENNQIPNPPNLPEHQRAAIDEFFEDVQFITSFLGYNFFTSIQKHSEKDVYYCKRSGIEAQGVYKDNKFVVLAGSKISNKEATSYKLKSHSRADMLQNQKLEIISDRFLQTKQDIIFNSPSSAASFCLGLSSNGWVDWKEKSGKTLDEVIRKKIC